jgi:hypothetical protein
VEASCRFYIAVDKLGCSTFDSLLLFLFWLEARGHTKQQPETPQVTRRVRAALGMVLASSSLCVPARCV